MTDQGFLSRHNSALLHAYLGASAAIIITVFMLPDIFGFFDLRQWAGMYTDAWCHVRVASASRERPYKEMMISAGREGKTVPLWTAPSHNEETCAKWAHDILCGSTTAEGWVITVAEPQMKRSGTFLGEGINVCGNPDFLTSPPWYHVHERAE